MHNDKPRQRKQEMKRPRNRQNGEHSVDRKSHVAWESPMNVVKRVKDEAAETVNPPPSQTLWLMLRTLS